MGNWFKRKLARRRLNLIVRVLPFALQQRYGAQNFYTAPQVKLTLEALKVAEPLVSSGFAIGCGPEEFLKGQPNETAASYRALRDTIAELYGISRTNFGCRDLRALGRPSSGSLWISPPSIPPENFGANWPNDGDP